jgi:hypothetical protein
MSDLKYILLLELKKIMSGNEHFAYASGHSMEPGFIGFLGCSGLYCLEPGFIGFLE